MLIACPTPSQACTLPVFRYALERWPAGEYEVCVIHDVQQKPVSQRQADAWAAGIASEANVRSGAVLIAVEAPEIEADRLIIEELRKTDSLKLPQIVLAMPVETGGRRVVWSGSLEDPVPAALASSPARDEISKQLLSGMSAVWILVRSGDEAADAAASAMLKSELQKLEKTLELPEQPAPEEADDVSRMRSKLPLKLAFSVVEVNRDDAAEETLISLLERCDELHAAPGVDQAAHRSPAAYAVFGRGRAMPGLRGETFTPAMIENVADFLIGPCSCQVKELNPGMDLLMTVDWDEVIFADAPARVTPAAPVAQTPPDPVATRWPAAPVPPAAVTPTNDQSSGIPIEHVLLISCIAVAVIAGVRWIRAARV